MGITDKVAIKAPSGFSYKCIDEIKINDVKLKVILSGINKELGDINTKCKELKKFNTGNTKSIDKILKQKVILDKQLKSIEDKITSMKSDILTNKHDKLALAYQSFKVLI